MKTISAAQANRNFSKLLRDVKEGATVVVTSRGQPVARIEPARAEDCEEARREAAFAKLMTRLRSQSSMNIPITWTRDDVYDDDF